MSNSFQNDLTRAMENIRTRANSRLRRVCLAAYQRIVDGSPVDQGTFKANWLFCATTLDRSFNMDLRSSDIPAMTSSATAAITSEFRAGSVYYICNSVPYAIALEHGHSRQFPNGVVGPANRLIAASIRAGEL